MMDINNVIHTIVCMKVFNGINSHFFNISYYFLQFYNYNISKKMKFCLRLNFEIEKIWISEDYPILLYKIFITLPDKRNSVTRYFAKKIWSLWKLWIG